DALTGLLHCVFRERDKGFEPSTSTLARLHSTTELVPQRTGYLARPREVVKEDFPSGFVGSRAARNSWSEVVAAQRSGARAAARARGAAAGGVGLADADRRRRALGRALG